MRFARLLLLLLFPLLETDTLADNCFQLCKSSGDSLETIRETNTYDKSTVFKVTACRTNISGLSISGKIWKYSPNYSVRILLKDKYQQEYVIFEKYEELNDDEEYLFKDYAEETLLLDNILPDSIKVCITDACIQIDSITMRHSSQRDRDIFYKQIEIRNKQIKEKVQLINNYNIEKGRPWIADVTKLSLLPYETRKRIIGFSDDTTSGGLEYYAGGYFVVGHDEFSNNRELGNDPFVDSFDWRNRHSNSWVSSVKDQGCTYYCAAFAGLACVESLIKLYYNNASLEVDLSEQEIASCADTNPHLYYDELSIGLVENYIHGYGVCDENAYPLITSCDPFDSLSCESGNITPNEWFQTGNVSSVFCSLRDIKAALIAKGPLYSGWSPSSGSGHAMALVGYGKLHEGDSVRKFNPDTGYATIQHSVPQTYVGSTYWIFKDSDGPDVGDNGYYYLIFSSMIGTNENVYINDMRSPFYFNLPITSLNYTDNDIIIEDADGDGFYNWGLGNKPLDCPSWIPDIEDGDDSDPTKGAINEFGHLTNISALIRDPWTLSSDYTKSLENELLYGNIIIPNGRTLTLTGTIMSMGNTSITVEAGGTLVIDGGILANAKINLSSYSHLIIRNGGIIHLNKDHDFTAPIGSIIEIEEGEIRGPYIKKSSKWN